MHYTSDVPGWECVGFASNTDDLADLFEEGVGTSSAPFLYLAPPLTGPRSGRILYLEERIEGFNEAALPRPYTFDEAAKSFFDAMWMLEARFDPVNPPSATVLRGWEVRKARVGYQLILIVLTHWVSGNRYTPIKGEGHPSPE